MASSQPTLQASQLRRLLEISTMLSSTLDLSQLLEMVIQAAAELTDMQHASLLLLDKQQRTLEFVATSNEPALVGVAVPLESSIAGWVTRQAMPLTLENVQADTRHYAQVDQFTDIPTNSMIAVPLIYKETTIGVLEAINKRDEGECTPQDVAVLEALASQAAVAIENARLFQQTDVIAEIMHELKTPLLALTAATELLERPNLPADKQQRIIQMLRQQGIRMTRMVQGYLELARFESGRVRLKWEEVDLAAVAETVADMQRPQAAQKEITIEVQNHTAELPTLQGDVDKLQQVLLNLVSNAIKYTPNGGHVVIDLHHDAAQKQLVAAVVDNGPGIAPQNVAHLFERFYRVPGSEGYTEGTGLGLSISRKIVEAHHGRVEVESELGKGSAFRCIFNLDLPDS